MRNDFYDDEWEAEAVIYRLGNRYKSIVAKFESAEEAIDCLLPLMVALQCTLVVETRDHTDHPLPVRCSSAAGTREIVANYPNFLL